MLFSRYSEPSHIGVDLNSLQQTRDRLCNKTYPI